MSKISTLYALPLLALSALCTLSGCSASAGQDTVSQERKEPIKQVAVQIGDANEVTIDIPEKWDVDTSSGYANITPDDFDGIIQVGVNLSPVSAVASDEELLHVWQDSDTSVTGEWERVSTDADMAPMYESPAKLEGDKNAEGIVRVVISGDDAIAVNAYIAGDDWDEAKEEIEEVLNTFKVSDPQAPNYSEPSQKDVFTIANAQKTKELGYGFWELGVTVQNNSDAAKNFLGFQIDELDAEGNIINSYMSYNKNSMPTVVEPGQQLTIPLTEAYEDNIAGIQSRYCEWGDDISTATRSDYSQPFKVMF